MLLLLMMLLLYLEAGPIETKKERSEEEGCRRFLTERQYGQILPTPER